MELKAGKSLYAKSRKSAAEKAIAVIYSVIIVLCVLTLLFNMRYAGVYVVESSMLPTLVGAPSENEKGGDYVYMDTYAHADYGDIIVIKTDRTEYGKRVTIIKRAIAFGGDSVIINGGKVYIKYASDGADGKFRPLNESYVSAENNTPAKNNFPSSGHDPTKDEGYKVEKNCVFCLGDNRDDSRDSRVDGEYKLSQVLGVVPAWALKIKNFTTGLNNLFK